MAERSAAPATPPRPRATRLKSERVQEPALPTLWDFEQDTGALTRRYLFASRLGAEQFIRLAESLARGEGLPVHFDHGEEHNVRVKLPAQPRATAARLRLAQGLDRLLGGEG